MHCSLNTQCSFCGLIRKRPTLCLGKGNSPEAIIFITSIDTFYSAGDIHTPGVHFSAAVCKIYPHRSDY